MLRIYNKLLYNIYIVDTKNILYNKSRLIMNIQQQQKHNNNNNKLSTLSYIPSENIKITNNPIISIAPMVDVTDQYFRSMCRMLSKSVVLYTPMITDLSLLKDPYGIAKHLQYSHNEHKLVVQLGGSNPDTMSQAAQICESLGFDEININLGCPASSAQDSNYGAALVHDSNVFNMISAVAKSVHIPVTVKLRTSVYNTMKECNEVDDNTRYEWLYHFIKQIHRISGVTTYILHCRPAILKFRPDKNRTAPILNHHYAYKLKQDYPHFNIQINGEINSIDDIKNHLSHGVDGCMIGRAAWKNTYMLHEIDSSIFNDYSNSNICRYDIIQQYIEYAEYHLQKQMDLKNTLHNINWKPLIKNLLNPLLYLFNGCQNSVTYRTVLSDGIQKLRQHYMYGKTNDVKPVHIRDIVNIALSSVDDYVLYNRNDHKNIRAVNIQCNPNHQAYRSIKSHQWFPS